MAQYGEILLFHFLLNILSLMGFLSEENPFLFNGDFVDRGSFLVEVILTLFAFKCMRPSAVHLSRGNDESKSMDKIYGFEGEVRCKLSDTFVELFAEVFCCLPLAHVINEKIFIVHGGLFSVHGVKLADIKATDWFCEPPEEGLMCELLWSDPQPLPQRGPYKQGVGLSFGEDVTTKFSQENDLEYLTLALIRCHNDTCHYSDSYHIADSIFGIYQMANKCALIRFEAKHHYSSALPYPDVKPMFS